MKKFLVIYCMPAAAMKKMMQETTKEEMDKGMEEWNEWTEANNSSFADSGAMLGKNTRLVGSITEEVSNDLGGYSVMQGESKEAVLEVLKTSPHVGMDGAYIEVMECATM